MLSSSPEPFGVRKLAARAFIASGLLKQAAENLAVLNFNPISKLIGGQNVTIHVRARSL
jgi:hypothetical protein